MRRLLGTALGLCLPSVLLVALAPSPASALSCPRPTSGLHDRELVGTVLAAQPVEREDDTFRMALTVDELWSGADPGPVVVVTYQGLRWRREVPGGGFPVGERRWVGGRERPDGTLRTGTCSSWNESQAPQRPTRPSDDGGWRARLLSLVAPW